MALAWWLLASTLKVALIFAVAAFLQACRRRAAPTERHAYWAAAIVAMLILPAAAFLPLTWRATGPQVLTTVRAMLAPGTAAVDGRRDAEPGADLTTARSPSVGHRIATAPAAAAQSRTSHAPAPTAADEARAPTTAQQGQSFAAIMATAAPPTPQGIIGWLLATLPLIWLLGFLAVMLPWALGMLTLLRLAGQASPPSQRQWRDLCEQLAGLLHLRRRPRLLRSPKVHVPMTFGLLRPVILLPLAAWGWSETQQRMVLLHELAHVKRGDWAWQALGRLACAVWWFHPLTWWTYRQLRLESERACDQMVVRQGHEAATYADMLLDLAASAREARVLRAAGEPVVGRSGLRRRITSLLASPPPQRTPRILGAAMTILLLISSTGLAMLRLPAEPSAKLDEVADAIGTQVELIFARPPATPRTPRRPWAEPTRPARQPPVAAVTTAQPRSRAQNQSTPASRAAQRGPRSAVARSAAKPPRPAKPKSPRHPAIGDDIPWPLVEGAPDPTEAIVLSPDLRWSSIQSGPYHTTHQGGLEVLEDRLRMSIAGGRRANAYMAYYNHPIPWQHYPLLVVKYRARNVLPLKSAFFIWMDTGAGTRRDNGFTPFTYDKVIGDGEIHYLTLDLRKERLRGPLGAIAIGIDGHNEARSVMELLDVRFVAPPDAKTDAPSEPTDDLSAPAPVPDQAVTVQVVDNAGRPVPGALVAIDPERTNWAARGATDEAGLVTLTPWKMPGDLHFVRVEKHGHPIAHRHRIIAGSSDPVTVTLPEGVVYGGIVLDETGRAVPNAGVMLHVLRTQPVTTGWRNRAFVMTDQHGRWETPVLGVDVRPLLMRVAHEHYNKLPPWTVQESSALEALRHGEYVTRLVRGVSLRGVVTDEAGSAVRAAELTLRRIEPEATIITQFCEQDGSFRVDGLAPGKYLLLARDRRTLGVTRRAVALTDDPVDVRVALPPARVVHGSVQDPAGRPIADAYVVLKMGSGIEEIVDTVQTRKDGTFRWPRAPLPGTEALRVSIRHHEHLGLDIAEASFSDAPAMFTLQPLPMVRGRVTDAVTGAAVSRFTVTAGYADAKTGHIYWNSPESVSGTVWNTPDSAPGSEGTYASRSLARWATYYLRIEAPGYKTATSGPHKAATGEQVWNIALDPE